MNKYAIITRLRMAAFLAQVGHESGQLRSLVENLNYSAKALLRVWPKRFTPQSAALYAGHPEMIANFVYVGRMGNGPESTGAAGDSMAVAYSRLPGATTTAPSAKA